jgi:predicted thioesterase
MLKTREKNRFYFDITIKDDDRTVGKVEHARATVSLQKLIVLPV